MAHSHEFVAQVNWTGAAEGSTENYKTYSRSHEISIDGRPVILGSADPFFLGTSDRYNPEDLLVASLSACHLLSYLAVCSSKAVKVIGYRDNAWGKMELKEGAYRFTDVLLKPIVTIAADSDSKLAAELHHEAHKVCFIANSVNFPIRTDASIVIGG